MAAVATGASGRVIRAFTAIACGQVNTRQVATFGGAANFAGQRFAARLASDPPGTLTFRESVLVEGEAAQGAMRW